MHRTVIGPLILLMAGVALAGPPADYELRCGLDGDLVGVATVVDAQLHVALVDGALQACVDGGGEVVGVADGAVAFTVATILLDEAGAVVAIDATFAGDVPTTLTDEAVRELPDVAVEGMLGAQQNRAEAFARAEEARARAEERRGGPPADDDEEDDEAEGLPAAASARR